jgi:hypothetical protein
MHASIDRRAGRTRRITAVLAASAAVTGLLVATAPVASAGTEKVCNAAFCNTTTGSGYVLSTVTATKEGDNKGVLGFFEVFNSVSHQTGPTTTANTTKFDLRWTLDPKYPLVCLRFFAKTSRGFVEVGSAQCTKAPF